MRTIDEFCGQKNGYSLSKTLRNKLIPVGKTEDKIKEYHLMENDYGRAAAYVEVKNLIDDFHRSFIAERLDKVSLDWTNLFNALNEYQKNQKDKLLKAKCKKVLEAQQKEMRKKIVQLFTGDKDNKDPVYEKLFKKELIEELLPEAIKEDTSGIITQKEEALAKFHQFCTYFTNFHENRKTIYSAEDKSTAISNRIVNENFPKYVANIKVFEYLSKNFPKIIDDTENQLKNDLSGKKLKDIFTVNGFNNVLSQKGIDFYNIIIGGIPEKEGIPRKQGINEAINLLRQGLPPERKNELKQRMTFLYKQILSDKEKVSFIPEVFNDSKEVYLAVQAFNAKCISSIIDKIADLYKQHNAYNLEKIFVPAKSLTAFSQSVYGNWSLLSECIFEKEKGEKTLSEKKSEELTKKIAKNDYSLIDLQSAYDIWADKNNIEFNKRISINSYFNLNEIRQQKRPDGTYEKVVSNLIEDVKSTYIRIDFDNIKDLQQEKNASIPIKEYLDAVQNLFHYLKLVDYKGDALKDEMFYSSYDEYLQILSEIMSLYNKTRNFVTKKVGEIKKIKLNFDCSSLLSGWGTDYGSKAAHIFKSDSCFYLGIINKKLDKTDIDSIYQNGNTMIEKIVYDFQKPDNKNTPRLFIRSKGTAYAPAVSTYNLPIESVIDIYDKGLFKTEYREKNLEVYKKSLIKLIDYFKLGFSRHDSYKHYNFCWKETKDYADISEFYADTMRSCYQLKTERINFDNLMTLVDEGKLFLFQIYNKDFSTGKDGENGSTGRKNMHTLYWENLFSKENLDDVVLQLSGGAELFFRPKSLEEENATIHEKNSFIVNRTYLKEVKGNKEIYETIPEEIYQEIYQKLNGKTDTISDEAQELLSSGKVKYRAAPHRIIKDRHFTQDTYLFHCPISLNFKAQEITGKKFNDRVLEKIKNNSEIKIIGLDRGERNLIYLSLINQKGEIELQKTLNLVEQQKRLIDYQGKLVQKEGDRDKARKNWQTIGNIKELKEGYLSAVVHELATLMVDNNAIVVMEDLNFGFKRGRFAVERQVYQKFEHMFIDKLNYLVFKDRKVTEPGGVLNAYQLTDKLEAFKDLGKQSGFLFYVPAGYTSKIDPATGFANLLDMTNLTNVQKKRDFFAKFDSICFDEEKQMFAFTFDYKNFPGKGSQEMSRTKWTVYSNGKRIQFCGKGKASKHIENLTEEFKTLFREFDYQNGNNILDSILEVGAALKAGEKPAKEIADFWDKLLVLFKLVLQIRNSDAKTGDDYIISPVMSESGNFFDSREQEKLGNNAKLPKDADANGAYHIALKGLYLLKAFDKTPEDQLKKVDMKISNADWFRFAQEKEYNK